MKVPQNKLVCETMSCDLCMQEIPRSEAKCGEVHDYVMHFCGLDCYEKWRNQVDQKEQKEQEKA